MIWKQTYKTSISRAYGKPDDSLFRVKLCYILREYLGKKSVMYVQNTVCSPERSDYSNINKITQSTKSIWNRATITAFHSHIFRIT